MAKLKRDIEYSIKTKGSKDLKTLVRNTENLKKTVDRSARSLQQMERNSNRTAKALGALTGALVGFAVGRGFKAIVDKTVEQEQAIAQLEAAIKSTGNASGQSSAQLQEFAKQMQAVGVEGDEAVLGVQSMLLTFKEIGREGDVFNRTTQAVLDLSVAMKQDLKSSAVQLGKALNDPVANLGALGRTGIQFSKDQQELIKSLAKTGRMAEAQAIILAELESQFGGSAKAARETLGGAIKALQNNFGDLLEVSGSGTTQLTGAINDLADQFADPAFQRNVANLLGSMLNGAAKALEVYSNLSNVIGFLKDEIAAWYGIVRENDITRLLERQEELQAKINRGGLNGLLQNTELFKKQLAEVNAQLDAAYERIRKLDQLQEIEVTATRRGPIDYSPPDKNGLLQEVTVSQKLLEINRNRKKRIDEINQALKDRDMIIRAGMTAEELHNEKVERAAELYKAGTINLNEYQKYLANLPSVVKESEEAFTTFEDVLVKGFGDNFETMLDGVLQGTQSVKDGIKDMVKVMLAEFAKLAAYKTIMSMFGGTDFGASFGKANNVTKWAQGGVAHGGGIPFMTRSGMNVMAEKGPEAIMPLSRMADGNLGVAGAAMNVTVNNNAAGVAVQTSQGSDGSLTIEIIEEALVGKIAQGGNQLSTTLQNAFGLSRQGAY